MFVEAVAAPDYEPEAWRAAGKKNLRLMKVAPGLDRFVVKSITGGFLVQKADRATLGRGAAVVKSKRAPTEEEWRALEFGWKVAKHVKSNAIVSRAPGTRGRGCGADEPRRFGEDRRHEAVLPLAGAAVASDGSFPFADGLEEAVKNGATAFIQPGGSVRDREVIDAADRLGAATALPPCVTSGTSWGRPQACPEPGMPGPRPTLIETGCAITLSSGELSADFRAWGATPNWRAHARHSRRRRRRRIAVCGGMRAPYARDPPCRAQSGDGSCACAAAH